MIPSSCRGPARPSVVPLVALRVILTVCVLAVLSPPARAERGAVDRGHGAGDASGAGAPSFAIPLPPIREFSSAERLPPEDPDTIFAEPGRQDGVPVGPAGGEATKPSATAPHAGAGAGDPGASAADGKAGAGGVLRSAPLALPDPYLDPSWPDIRPPLSAERRKKQLEAAEAERERAASGGKPEEDEARVPMTDEDLYMKEEHADTWDEDFKDYKGNPTDVWDQEYEDPEEW